jgi:C1A family cysteine protease
LQFYSNGVFDDCNTFIDHAVALVGYKSGVGWKIKNSWGDDWGVDGYAWIAEQNTCGICNNAFSATV